MSQGLRLATRLRTILKRRLPRDERGSVIIMTAVSIIALFTFAIVAIDGSILMTTKTQLQNAADAAALAGASQLRPNSLNIDAKKALARAEAVAVAGANFAVQDSLQPVIIVPGNVTFPTNTQCRVDTYRTSEHGDPLRTYFLRFIDLAVPNTADVSAYAIASVHDICATTCLKPWAIPDRWEDANGNGQFDQGEFYDPIATGYQAPGDVGMQITLHLENPANGGPIEPGQFYSIALPPEHGPIDPLTGGAIYERWIRECAPFIVEPGDSLLLEPGAKVGPTRSGMEDLIAQDPGAYWDEDTQTVMGSDPQYGMSPRIALVPFFDPNFPPQSGRNDVIVSKIGAFFMEGVQGNGEVTGRFIQVSAPGVACDNNGNGFLFGIALIK